MGKTLNTCYILVCFFNHEPRSIAIAFHEEIRIRSINMICDLSRRYAILRIQSLKNPFSVALRDAQVLTFYQKSLTLLAQDVGRAPLVHGHVYTAMKSRNVIFEMPH